MRAVKSRPHFFCALALAVAGATCFLLAAARDLQPFDSSEFALNAAQLGVGHPPGQPAYLLLGAALVRLLRPLSPSFVLTLLSIAATVCSALLALRLATRDSGQSAFLAVITIAAALLVPGVWDFATRAEVYPLAALLVLAAIAPVFDRSIFENMHASLYARIGLLFGLAASVNPAIALAAALAAAPALFAAARGKGPLPSLRALAAVVAGGAIGLLP